MQKLNNPTKTRQPRGRRPANQPAEIQHPPVDYGPLTLAVLEKQSLGQLRQLARGLGIPNDFRIKKEDLIIELMRVQAERASGDHLRGGILETQEDGIGYLRSANYLPGARDIYISQSQINRFGLRMGDMVMGQVRGPKENEKYHSMTRVDSVNGLHPDEAKRRPQFEDLTPIFPDERFNLETDRFTTSTRLLNLVAPIGKGQRGLIVSPPKAGKTTVLKDIANAIAQNYPEVYMMVALIGERPEEVTDMDRSVEAEVVSSTFDEPVKSHVRVAEMCLARAKRLVEGGKDVVILMDSITRLARAYNLVVSPSGRTLSGGLDPAALYPPKRFFGAARNIEGGGSLTIIATCLIDTGSRMDDMVYEEFKGTGNMELHLSRRLQERRVFPAFDIERSSTRREELLLGPDITPRVWLMRRMFAQMITPPPGGAGMDVINATQAVIDEIRGSYDNVEFLDRLGKMGKAGA
ncbi:MAG TPA: transcription termination factor Rho [Anaerolineales bacterium]|nr:transcription termination factor Rho [Anaerolineales bacterium]